MPTFLWLFRETARCQLSFMMRMEIWSTYSRLKPPGYQQGIQTYLPPTYRSTDMCKAICPSFFKGEQNSSQQYNIVLINIFACCLFAVVCSQLTSEAHKSLIPILVFQWCMRPCIPSYTQPLRSYQLVWRHLRRGQIAWPPSPSYHFTCESNLIKLFYICKICSFKTPTNWVGN